jgi:hypothetical protein
MRAISQVESHRTQLQLYLVSIGISACKLLSKSISISASKAIHHADRGFIMTTTGADDEPSRNVPLPDRDHP